MKTEKRSRIESEAEVKTYLQNLQYALQNGANIFFQIDRRVDDVREEKYTNQYAVHTLFPDEDPSLVLRRELQTLTVEDYIETVQDIRFPHKSEMRVFGKRYNGSDEVYIKIRVELFGIDGFATTFVMSFHFAEHAFQANQFPYSE